MGVFSTSQDKGGNLESAGKALHVQHYADVRVVGDDRRDEFWHVRGMREGTATTKRESNYSDLPRNRIRRLLCLLNRAPQINISTHACPDGNIHPMEKNSIVTESGNLRCIALGCRRARIPGKHNHDWAPSAG